MTDALIIPVDSSQVEKGKRSLADLAAQSKKTEQSVSGIGTSFNRSSNSISALTGNVKALAGGFIGIQAVFGAISRIDVFTKFNAQLKLATRSQLEFAKATEDVSNISRIAQADISSIGTLYARINNSVRDLGASQKETADITENVALALKVSGATAQETSSAVLQLSQAFGSGVLRGEEFNAVNEAAPALMRALAESIGVPVGKLRELASQGAITSDVLLKAFGDDKLLEKFREQAKEVQTISGGWAVFTNQLTVAIGKINETTGASKILIGVLEKAATLLSVFEGGEKGSILRNFLDKLPKERDLTKESSDALRNLSKGGLRNPFSVKAQLELERRRKLLENQALGRADSTAIIAPNFNAGVEARDINKIRALEEERKRSAQSRIDDYKREKERAEDLGRKKLDTEQKLYDIKDSFDKQLRERELKHLDLVEKEQERVAKDKAETAQKYFEFEEKKRKEIEQEQERINKEQERVYEQLGDNLSRALTEGLFDSFKKGESFGRAMFRNITAFGKTLLAQIFQGISTNAIKSLFSGGGGASIFGGLSSIFSGGAQASTGGNSVLSSLSSLGDIFQRGNSALISGIESLGTFLSTGTGGLGDILGGALGQYAGTISNVLPFAGAAFNLLTGNVKGALGSALGAALSFTPLGPVGGIIGSIIGGGLFGGKKQPPRTVTALPEVNEQFINTLTALTKGFGLDSNITANARYSGRSGGSGYGFLDASVNGTAINEGIRYKGAYGEATLKQFIDTVLVSSVKRAIESLDLSDGIKKFFKDLTKQEEIVAAINGLVSLNAQLKTLPPVFDAIRTAIDTTAFKLSIEELQKQFSDTSVFTSLFYTAEEQFKIFTDQLTGQLTELNTALPKTRDEYRALIDGFKVTDEASSKLFGGLVALAPALDNYFKQIEAQKQQFAGLNADFFSTSDDFISASIKAGQGKDFSREIGDISSVRRNIDPESNAVVQALVEAQADTRALLESVAKAVQETARIQKIWNGDGLPETRVI